MVRPGFYLRALALVVCACALAQPLHASTVLFRTDAQLVSLSERVIHGRVVAQRAARGGPRGQSIYTVTAIQINEDLTGVAGESVEVWELGGTLDGEFMYVGGAVEYRIGEEVLVCLERGPMGLRSVAMGFSKFDVLREANGDRALRRNLANTEVIGGSVARERTLSEFKALASLLTGRSAVAGLDPDRPADVTSRVTQPFTLLGGGPGYRWKEADNGTPLIWYQNSSAPNPLLSGNGVAEVQNALAAWTAPTSASIILQYGGTTLQSAADGPWSGIPSNSSVITYEDPDNEISGSTLAIGGGWGASGAGGTVNGNTFHAFTRGYIIFQNAADLGSSYRQSLGFTRVLEHEVGHAIGLGHTQTDGTVSNPTGNIMYPSCCHTATPLPPAIGPDDLAGLNFIYPSGAQPCTFSINPTSASAAAAGGSGSVSLSTQAGCSWSASAISSHLSVSPTGGTGSRTLTYTVGANSSTVTRSGTLSIAGKTFTVNQAAAPCTYSISPSAATISASGGTGSVSISAPSGCSWTSSSQSGFLSFVSSSSGSGNGSVTYNVQSNGVSARAGTLTIAGRTFSVSQLGTGPTVALDRSALNFGATLSGASATFQTSTQTIRLSQSSGPAVNWTASSNQPWLTVSPTSGSGARQLTIGVNPNNLSVPSTLTGSVTLTLANAANFAPPITVSLRTMHTGASVAPIGVIDTPNNMASGVVGAIPVTGWAVDDVEVAMVNVCRAPIAGEVAGVDGRCSNSAQFFLGEAVFVDGARPDVNTSFSTFPRSTRGGWGFMLLTNMLPNQGNGTYTLYAHAVDRELHSTLIGSRTISCANAQSAKPFGAIDTPAQGGVASGSNYLNFGWALTPQPKTIPTNGSTITVFVDGVSLGHPTYNNYRSDIASLFPGYKNTDGAVGFLPIDTTALADGLHTIAWTVTDDQNATEGIGSRYFSVLNSSGGVTAAIEASSAATAAAGLESIASLPIEPAAILGRRGWAPDAPWRSYGVGPSGRVVVRAEEVGRLELRLPRTAGSTIAGYLQSGADLEPLPVGSKLDPATGTFTWSPGVGFVGTYDLVFVRTEQGNPVSRQNVRVVLQAKGSGFVGPQIVIDTPKQQQDVPQPFLLAGWAADLHSNADTGISAVHAWAYPLAGGPPTFLGGASYGGTRPDVAAVHGDQFRDSGFGLYVQGLIPGNYDVAVFAWSTELGDFLPARVVRLTVR